MNGQPFGGPSQASALQEKLRAASDRLAAGPKELEALVREHGTSTLSRLEISMNRLYYLAIFIRGAYDDRSPDDAQRTAIVSGIVAQFQEADSKAQQGLAAIRAQLTSLTKTQDDIIVRNQTEAEKLLHEADGRRPVLEDQTRALEARAHEQQARINMELEKINELHQKLAQAESMSPMYALLSFGIGNIVGAVEVTQIRDAINQLQNAIQNGQQEFRETQMKMQQLQIERAQLEYEMHQLQQAHQQATQLNHVADIAQLECGAAERRFVPLTAVTANLLKQAQSLEDAGATSKKDIALHILKISADVLMDQALEDEVRMVRDEIVKEYGQQVPEEVEAAASSLNERITNFRQLPNLRG